MSSGIEADGGRVEKKTLTQRHVVLLEATRRRRFVLGRDDRRVCLACQREGRVVDAGDLHTDRHVKVRLDRGERHVVKNDRLEVSRHLC